MSKKKKFANNGTLNGDGRNYVSSSGNGKLLPVVTAKNEGQKLALKAISEHKITVITGVPGSGKTHISIGWGLQEMLRGEFEKLVLTRPILEAGENLGFLPGKAKDKVAPYMMPMYEILSQYLSTQEIKDYEIQGKIKILPIAYMRGITFNNACVIADECQNANIKQMHMILTRLGTDSKIIMTGDVRQSDIRSTRSDKGVVMNGLEDATERLKDINEVGFVDLGYEYCVRDPLVNIIDERYRNINAYPKDQYKSKEINLERFRVW